MRTVDFGEKLEELIESLPDLAQEDAAWSCFCKLLGMLEDWGMIGKAVDVIVEDYLSDVVLDEYDAYAVFDALMTKDPQAPAKARALLGAALGRFSGVAPRGGGGGASHD